MKADPSAQQRLLELQTIDTTLTQLAHRRANLPELAELERLAEERTGLRQELTAAQVDVDALDRDIARLERDVEQVRARRERDSARLASGVGPARELTALSHEIESLDRRQRELEDSQLELMERREQAQEVLDGITNRLRENEQQIADAERRRDAALAEISEQEAAHTAARKPLVNELPADLVALYERIRQDTGGIGAALLRGGRCGGCQLELAGSDRARIKAAPADEVIRCEECRRILVRTAESGL
ncbi:MAG TPA: C4-type zinc ribbon domain-containing protein [Natronosporangium sp.]|nr:C4-type zinc ribbon domain-containing protein [Natronosporangium sp.]